MSNLDRPSIARDDAEHVTEASESLPVAGGGDAEIYINPCYAGQGMRYAPRNEAVTLRYYAHIKPLCFETCDGDWRYIVMPIRTD